MEDIIMRVRHSKLLALIGAGILAVTTLVACGNGDATTAQPSAVESSAAESTVAASSEADSAETTADLSGSISMEEYPDVTVTAEFVGSGAGIEAVTNGTADIGNSSRSLKDEEKAAGVVENVVAIDGIAVCVDPANEVADLTKEQLTNIYNGTITNWKEVGGADEPIIVIGREAGSGTRGAFEELVDLKDACKYANELDSTGAVIAKVASTPGAIGYASLDALDDSVKALSLEGVEATAENIKAGNYFLSRPFVMATKGEISEQNDLVQAWFDFVLGDEGQQVASEVGLITVK